MKPGQKFTSAKSTNINKLVPRIKQINEIEAAAKAEAKPVKQRKQPRPIELQNKADSIGLSHLEIDRNDELYTVSKRKCYGGEVLFSSKSGISVSRQLTKMAWEHAIARNPRVNNI